MRILACPGQGSQTHGFLAPWLSEVEGFRDRMVELGSYSGLDLIALGTEADEDTIKDTAIAQPLIVAASIAAARSLFGQELAGIDGVAGHSVGEFAAAALAGVITDESAMRLVKIRGEAMGAASAKVATGMVAIIGGEPAEVAAATEKADLVIANYNGAGQFVAAGTQAAIAQLIAAPPEKSRVIPLKVAGAFHTEFMQSAVSALRAAAAEVQPSSPKILLWSNFDGSQITDPAAALESLISQVARPVRWDLCMENMGGVTQLIELPPAGALAGLAKRAMGQVTSVALKIPADIEKIG